MPGSADSDGWIVCRGTLHGQPCGGRLWRLDGDELVLQRRLANNRPLDLRVPLAHAWFITYPCPRCGTVWRPTPQGPDAPPPITGQLKRFRVDPDQEAWPDRGPWQGGATHVIPDAPPAPAPETPAPFSAVVWADGHPARRPQTDEDAA